MEERKEGQAGSAGERPGFIEKKQRVWHEEKADNYLY